MTSFQGIMKIDEFDDDDEEDENDTETGTKILFHQISSALCDIAKQC